MNRFAYLLVLQGDYGYGHGWEDLTAVDKRQPRPWPSIRQHLREYQENEGGNYRVIERRVAAS